MQTPRQSYVQWQTCHTRTVGNWQSSGTWYWFTAQPESACCLPVLQELLVHLRRHPNWLGHLSPGALMFHVRSVCVFVTEWNMGTLPCKWHIDADCPMKQAHDERQHDNRNLVWTWSQTCSWNKRSCHCRTAGDDVNVSSGLLSHIWDRQLYPLMLTWKVCRPTEQIQNSDKPPSFYGDINSAWKKLLWNISDI